MALTKDFKDTVIERMNRDPEFAKALRQEEVKVLAKDTFGNAAKARAWLRRPLAELSGKTPLDVAQTEDGARLIKTILGKIAWGLAS